MLFYPMAVAVCALSGVGETVLLDFQADWCGPCRSMHSTVQRLQAAGYPVRQVNIDHEPDLARQYNVGPIPCFVAVVDGRERGRQVGASSYEQLKQMMTSAGMQPNQGSGVRDQGSGVRDQGPGIGQQQQAPVVARGQSPAGGLPRLGLPRLGRRAAPAAPANAMAGGVAIAPPVVEFPPPSPPPAPSGMLSAPMAGNNAGAVSPPGSSADPNSFAGMGSEVSRTQPGLVPGAAPQFNAPPMPSSMPHPGVAGPSGAADTSFARTLPPRSLPRREPGAIAADGSLESRLLQASVRIRVEGTADVAVGSGTIIDQRQNASGVGGEALVLTCAHIFRESQGRAPIKVERFDAQMPQATAGRLLRYDLERDVALVTFRVDGPVPLARLAPIGSQAQQSDPVISIGCDNGQPPTVHRSQVIAINKIQGAPNLQVSGQPAVGRSGGGLFDVQGKLIGICNFADPQDQAGLYADVVSGHALLAQAGLADISKAAGLAAGETALAGGPSSAPPMPAMPASMSRTSESTPSSASTELICVVRTGTGTASHNETIIISNASPDLVNRLMAEHRGGQAAFATSLEVPREPQRTAPPPQAPTEPVARSNWQPQWR